MRELPRLNQSLRPTKNKQNKTNKQTNKQTNHTNKQTNRSPFPPWALVAFSRQLCQDGARVRVRDGEGGKARSACGRKALRHCGAP